jgi:tetratricopeptide (TPR) repeat protein
MNTASVYYRSFLIGGMLALLSACQMFQTDSTPVLDPNRLESISPADVEPASRLFQSQQEIQLDEVIQSYKQLLPLLDTPEDQLRVLHRLADLKLAKGEELMAEQAIDELDIAVDAYNGLLERYPNREANDRVYYQLAKTYDLKGDAESYLATLTTLVTLYPASKNIAEAHFRRGEVLFSAEDYALAQQAFEKVIAQGESPFLANAFYMKGWSQFKQVRYEDGLLSFVAVLDLVMPKDTDSAAVSNQSQTMINDLYRVMGLSFSYLGGADAVENLFAQTGPRNYEANIYDEYANLLLEKEQFSDAVEVFKRFIKLHPYDLNAPRYQIAVIDTLQRAGFKSGIVEEKVLFVESYKVGSEFWRVNQNQDLALVFDNLKLLLPELANRHYVLGRKAEKDENQRQKQLNFLKAAEYYQIYIDTFPNASDQADTRYLLAECHVALEQWAEAIFSFEAAGYDFPRFERAAEAAYASILAYKDYAKTWDSLDPELRKLNQLMQQKSRLRFVDTHYHDERADDVLFAALQFSFNSKDYNQAVVLAERLLSWQPASEEAQVVEARIMKAHSLYALEQYVDAELAYGAAIAGLPSKDDRKNALTENLAASVYKQAEASLEQGDKAAAIDQLLRVGQVAPQSSLRSNAEYDAISYMIELSRWKQAIAQILSFRALYPKHELVNTLVPKMALSYRETSQWELAADEIGVMSSLATTEQERKDNLFIAAELYDRADNKQKAIQTYRRYANTYPEPPDVYLEAANRLAELYDETGDQIKRRFWLKKQMDRVDSLGDKADDRMVYLAASASVVFANDAFSRYASIKLKLPLNESMIKKSEALEKAMNAFQKTASYGVSSFSTEAGFRMADIYAQLSRDLMDSDRPSGLNELELEQYDILLEEQAFPFEDNAIEIHEQNASRSWSGIYDKWVKNSYKSLKRLLPGRYDKTEVLGGIVDDLP